MGEQRSRTFILCCHFLLADYSAFLNDGGMGHRLGPCRVADMPLHFPPDAHVRVKADSDGPLVLEPGDGRRPIGRSSVR